MTTTTTTELQTTEHLRTVWAELNRSFDALSGKLAKLEGDALKARYVKNGPVMWAAKFIDAEGKLADLLKREDDVARYDELSNLLRVVRRFGTEIPARFTSWGAVVLAVTLDDDAIAALPDTKASTIRTAKREAKPTKTTKAEQSMASTSGNVTEPERRRRVFVAQGMDHKPEPIDFTNVKHQRSFAALANLMAAHLQAGGDVDPDVWASLKVSLTTILG